MIGQLRPQPTEVMAGNTRPADAMRGARSARFGLSWNEFPDGSRATCRLSAELTIGRRACLPGHVGSLT